MTNNLYMLNFLKRRYIINYYNEIKNEIINNEINRKVKTYSINRSDLNTYYNIGKLLLNAGKHYGEGIINNYSKRLTKEFGKGYGVSNLKNMRKFYNLFSKGQALPGQLSWSHCIELIKLNNMKIINYYIKITVKMH